MQSSGQQAADFLKVLYPTLQKSGLKTQIACCDGSGWEQQRSRLTGIQAAGYEYTLGLVTSHGYSSYPGAPFKTDKKVWQTEWSTFDNLNYDWYREGSTARQSEGLTWAQNIQHTFAVSNVTGFIYWWGAANATDNEALIFINGTSEVKPTKRLWAHAHFGSRFIRRGARRVGATTTSANLNVTAFANTDGTTAVQVINNGASAETVTLQGLAAKKVGTFLTNQAHNLTEGTVAVTGGEASAEVPGKSLLSFYVS